MEQHNSTLPVIKNSKLQNNLKDLIESLSGQFSPLPNAQNSREPGQAVNTPGQIPLSATSAAVDVSSLSDNSVVDCSISSVGYVADTSEIHQSNTLESPVKEFPINQAAPLTPTANLKMLVAAASSAFDREKREMEEAKKVMMTEAEDPSTSRKLKSLALLCKKFLQVADEEIGAGKEFSLEMMANSLGINRRRIYDIINVMEALEMISKQSKNWYLWHGRGNLLGTLAKLKAMAGDDPDIRPYLEGSYPEKDKENVIKKEATCPKDEAEPNHEAAGSCEQTEDADEDDDRHYYEPADYPFAARSVRYDKSLGVLCQKFVMLFLISRDNEVTLEEAGRILVPDYNDDTLYVALNPPVNPKTKVRRLYDIANILTSLGLIRKKVFVGPHHIKKPGYSWSGPTIQEIDSIWINKKHELTQSAFRKCVPKKHPGHPSQSEASLYCSPIKFGKPLGGSKFKRSLSFGGMSSSAPQGAKMCSTPPLSKQSTVVARPLCPKQVDYLREMREFESEMKKHAHRYPHVASIFHEFLQKYQCTLEQTAAANGRFILPKAIPADSMSSTPKKQQDAHHCHTPQSASLPDVSSRSAVSGCVGTTMSSVWDNCTHNESETHMPIAQIPLPHGHGSMPVQSQVPALMHTQQVPYADNMPVGPVNAEMLNSSSSVAVPQTNSFVTNLANSILANIFGTIQSTASIDLSSVQQAQGGVQDSNMIATSYSQAATTPLAEIQNMQEKATMIPLVSAHKEGFVNVDELLVKPVSQGFEYIPAATANYTFGALVNQKPITTPLESLGQNCPIPTDSTMTSVNPNAFLTSHQCAVSSVFMDKENLPLLKCGNRYEKSPKRQRFN